MRFCKSQFFLYQAFQPVLRAELAQARVFFGTKEFCILQKKNRATTLAAGFLRVPPKSFFKRLVLSTGLWQHAKMSTTLKDPNRLKDLECKKGQVSSRPPILYVLVTDLVTINSLTPKSVPAGTKLVLFGRYVLNIYVGIVWYFLRTTNSARQNLLTHTTHKSANIVRY